MSKIMGFFGHLMAFVGVVFFVFKKQRQDFPLGLPMPLETWLFANAETLIFIGLGLTAYQVFSAVRGQKKKRTTLESGGEVISENSDAAYQTRREASSSVSLTGELATLREKVEWTPLVMGGASFKSVEVNYISETRIVVKSSKHMKIFATFFMGMGLCIPGLFVYDAIKDSGMAGIAAAIVPLLVCLAFVGVGIVMLLFPRPRVIDKNYQWLWIGSVENHGESQWKKWAYQAKKRAVALQEIKALQVVGERVVSKDSVYYSYELNAILNDASRMNIYDHGNKVSALEDAQKIANFLNVPLWTDENIKA